ncbi:MAG: hypothetical protein ACLRZ9_04300 [Eubacterium sp.]
MDLKLYSIGIPAILNLALPSLLISSLNAIWAGFIVSAISVSSSGALEGLGKGAPSLAISLCRYVVIIIPSAFVLSHLGGQILWE